MSVTAQALDVVYGRSAAGVRARLERPADGGWQVMSHAETDCDGKIYDWIDDRLEQGAYRIVFDSDSYFASLGMSAAYPEVAVLFRVQDEADTCQIQVLLAPFSYSMYFGTRG
ncbi:hydroxyisourate hydrolase [Actinoplanes regularis]|uniref:hydroxyisourate hydrolase n=1 Tax=Actinoplanes regularis TaxID=52697 RepID=UPI0024A020AE|nr:hydroxyisourate hydrolase [Actinoplanes regularis]GLW33565.1 5-hydroxyisourate hydrolase [Actinoplanes regularis]